MQATRHARLLVGALILLLPGIAAAQAQFGIVNNVGLSFGSLGTSASAGTAVLDPATGVVTVTGGVVNLGGTHTAASFTITVPPPGNASYMFTLPSSPVTLSGPGSATMFIDPFTSKPPCPSSTCSGKGRNDILTVGGTLHVSANQAQGSYSGSFIVIANRP
jgi:hypothetical protein